MKCRNIFLGTAFTNYPFLWNTAGFICFKTTTGNTHFHTYCRLFSLQLLYAQISRVSLAPNCRGLPCWKNLFPNDSK